MGPQSKNRAQLQSWSHAAFKHLVGDGCGDFVDESLARSSGFLIFTTHRPPGSGAITLPRPGNAPVPTRSRSVCVARSARQGRYSKIHIASARRTHTRTDLRARFTRARSVNMQTWCPDFKLLCQAARLRQLPTDRWPSIRQPDSYL